MIDWDKPVRQVGTTKVLEHERAGGTDRWVTIPNGQAKYSSSGKHIRYPHESRLPDLENVGIDWDKHLSFADQSGERAWFSHKIRDTESDAVVYVVTDKSGNVHTYQEDGTPISPERPLRNVSPAMQALREKKEAEARVDKDREAMEDNHPLWGAF